MLDNPNQLQPSFYPNPYSNPNPYYNPKLTLTLLYKLLTLSNPNPDIIPNHNPNPNTRLNLTHRSR